MHQRSKREVRLAFELARFFKVVVRDQRIDPPGRAVNVDVKIPSLRVAVEYDSAYWHGDRPDDTSGPGTRLEADERKTAALQAAGWLVVRVRELPLQPTGGVDVFINKDAPIKSVTDDVLLAFRDKLGVHVPGLSDYLSLDEVVGRAEADAFILLHTRRL